VQPSFAHKVAVSAQTVPQLVSAGSRRRPARGVALAVDVHLGGAGQHLVVAAQRVTHRRRRSSRPAIRAAPPRASKQPPIMSEAPVSAPPPWAPNQRGLILEQAHPSGLRRHRRRRRRRLATTGERQDEQRERERAQDHSRDCICYLLGVDGARPSPRTADSGQGWRGGRSHSACSGRCRRGGDA